MSDRVKTALTDWETGVAAMNRFFEQGTSDDLDAATDAFERAERLAEGDAAFHVAVLSALVGCYWSRFTTFHDWEAGGRAVETNRKAAAVAIDTETRLGALIGAAMLQRERYNASRDLDLLDDVIATLDAIFPELSVEDGAGAMGIAYLALALRARFLRRGTRADLDRCLPMFVDLVTRGPEDEENPSGLPAQLGAAYLERLQYSGHIADADGAIGAFRTAVSLSSGQPPEAVTDLRLNLLSALQQRLQLVDSADDWREVAELAELVDATSDASVDVLEAGVKAWAEVLRHGANAEVAGRAVAAAERLALRPEPGGTSPTVRQFSVASSHLLRYDFSASVDDLNAAISALEAVGPSDELLAERTHLLARAYADRALSTGSGGDLDRAIELLDAAQPGENERWADAGRLAEMLLERSIHRGDRADLDRGIAVLEHELSVAPDVPDEQATRNAVTLGALVHEHFKTDASISRLERALELFRSAVAGADALGLDDVAQSARINIGLCSIERALASGDLAELDEAISGLDDLISDEASVEDRARAINTLGAAVTHRARRLNSDDDLDRAVDLFQQAVDATMPGDGRATRYLNSLAVALVARGRERRDLGDLDRAIAHLERALPLAPSANEAAMLRHTLAEALIRRFDLSPGEVEDVQRAAGLQAEAVELASDSALRAKALLQQGGLLRGLYAALGYESQLLGARDAYRAAAEDSAASPDTAMHAAAGWGETESERGDWSAASHAFSLALEHADELFTSQVTRAHKEAWLEGLGQLAADAAYALARADRATDAVAAVERGRTRVLNEVLERATAELDALRQAGHEQIADRFLAASRRVDEFDRDEQVAAPIATQRQARAELRDALNAIRQIAGFEHYLVPEGVELDLEDAAAVHLCATKRGGIALLSRPAAEPGTIWLDGFTEPWLRRLATDFATARQAAAQESWEATLDDTVRAMWDILVAPLFDQLDRSLPLVVIAGGLLGLLPLHAARAPDPEPDGGGICLLDVVEVRYAPSLRSLASARRANRGEPDSLLAVADPHTRGLPLLPGAAGEALDAADRFATNRVLAGPSATVDEVLAVLDEYEVVHFACHGYADLRDPMGGGLALTDETLTARMLLAHHLTDTRLAVLSACETSVYGTHLADEMLGVPGAFLQAGAAGVVGSLWSVPDVSTRLLMSRFYTAWREEQLAPPAALRAAQQWLRGGSNADFEAQVEDYTAPAGLGDSPAALGRWRADKPFAAPVYWAAFTYLGV